MRTPLLILLLPVGGCYLVADGAIECTSDGPKSCFPDTDTDSGVDTDTDSAVEPGPAMALGLALSYAVAGTESDGSDTTWYARAWSPEAWTPSEPVFFWDGVGELLGKNAFDPDDNAMFVAASTGKIYRLPSQDGASPRAQTYVGPDDAVVDLSARDGVAWMAAGTGLHRLDPSSGAGLETLSLTDGSALFDVAAVEAVVATEDGTYVAVEDSGGARDLLLYRRGTGITERVIDDYLPGTTAEFGDIFLGPDDALWGCDRTGRLAQLEALGSEDQIVPSRVDATRVLACGWDEEISRFVIVSTEGGAVSVDLDGATEILLKPDQEDFLIYGATLY